MADAGFPKGDAIPKDRDKPVIWPKFPKNCIKNYVDPPLEPAVTKLPKWSKCAYIITNRKRSLGPGNVFIPVCQSFCSQWPPKRAVRILLECILVVTERAQSELAPLLTPRITKSPHKSGSD